MKTLKYQHKVVFNYSEDGRLVGIGQYNDIANASVEVKKSANEIYKMLINFMNQLEG